ncbi:MAG: cation/acetate symporter [Planctomycetota bacterium]
MTVQQYTFLFVGLSFSLYLFIAWRARVRDTGGFYVAGRGVPAIANGIATAADWMSAASFLSMAGLVSFMGYAGGVYLMGWTGGFVLLALLLAPYLRKSGRFTVPDFVGDRFESQTARLVALVCALFISFTYVAGQMRGVGIVFARFLEVDINIGVVLGMAIVFVYATLGGMKGITYTQVAQYWVLIVAFLIPVVAISLQLTGEAVPQLGMGSELTSSGQRLLTTLDQIHQDLGFPSYTDPFDGSWDKVNVFCTTLALMAGTAGLPHVIVRFYTVKNVQAARWSGFWAIFFIAILYLTAPATAAFSRYFVFDSLATMEKDQPPAWFEEWEQSGLVIWLDSLDETGQPDGKITYLNGDENELFCPGKGITADEVAALKVAHAQWLDSNGKAGADGRLILRQKGKGKPGPDRDIMVLALPQMAGLAAWIIALVAAGGLAAALSTASGLLLVISSSVVHDFYYRMIRPTATDRERLRLSRIAIGGAVVIAGLFGIYPPGFVAQVVAFAFGLASSSFFPVLVLGIFSMRVGAMPAIAGMVCGIGFTASYILSTVYFDGELWCFGIKPEGIGAIGMLVNFAVAGVLTPFCKPPSAEARDLVRRIREPEDDESSSPVVH